MWSLILFVAIGLFGSESFVKANCTIEAKGNLKFPKKFNFGVATSAYQIEGGWNADGKGPSIWDEFTHNYPERIIDGSNGDSAAESYRLFELDLQALKQLGAKHYRFSIAWTRIFPTGDVHLKNQKGIDYYNMVINKLRENKIEPMVTMYHWDLPVALQKFGGFANALIIDQFSDYAEELFKLFGDRVKTWITFNEPNNICKAGYGTGYAPPLIQAPGVGDYICFTNLLKAHGTTYRLYQKKFAKKQKGKIGITLDIFYLFSKTNNTDDVNRAMDYNLGLLAYPIFSKSGDFPPIVLKEIEKSSMEEGRAKSRLPSLGEYWTKIIKGSGDFIGINYYTSRYVKPATEPMGENPSMERDINIQMDVDPNWPRAKADWVYCIPQGLESLLKYLRDEYNNVEVKITENGWVDSGELNDDNRIRYFKSHIQAVLNAINDGCNVTSYSAWSLVDNFEWLQGYTEKFGLYSVNMKSTKKGRIPKKSALYYKKVIATRSVPVFEYLY
ncbi:myrosinase 1-like [Episyrphus balteatus]|uniref:myrosinase 1-like n=1 Tax=Episyrphus balteatus TaxID=286459 RepID=UPI002485D591|nr:myrosinase 1-like [Episyrphus balteatus]